MAKFINNPGKASSASIQPAGIVKSTSARNSPLPKPQGKREITHEMIAKRAYEIYVSGKGGSQYENWIRAERELKAI